MVELKVVLELDERGGVAVLGEDRPVPHLGNAIAPVPDVDDERIVLEVSGDPGEHAVGQDSLASGPQAPGPVAVGPDTFEFEGLVVQGEGAVHPARLEHVDVTVDQPPVLADLGLADHVRRAARDELQVVGDATLVGFGPHLPVLHRRDDLHVGRARPQGVASGREVTRSAE
ncbi:hypothetical protein ACQP1W_25995 [Spirillospora sp. CA-255316]